MPQRNSMKTCGCSMGCGMIVAIVCIVFGASAMYEYSKQNELTTEMEEYSIASLCNVSVVTTIKGEDDCTVYRYVLQVQVWGWESGFAYGNFEDDRCDGITVQRPGTTISCWARQKIRPVAGANAKVRVSDVIEAESIYLLVGSVLLLVGLLPLVLFLLYNVFLCVYACATHNRRRERRRQQMLRRRPHFDEEQYILEMRQRNDPTFVEEMLNRRFANIVCREEMRGRRSGGGNEQEGGWFRNNVYARFVMDRVGSGDTDEDECIVCFETFGTIKNMILWPCGHYLCEECTRKIFGIQEEAGCPQCRQNARFYALTCVTPTQEAARRMTGAPAAQSREPVYTGGAPGSTGLAGSEMLVVGAVDHNAAGSMQPHTPPPDHMV